MAKPLKSMLLEFKKVGQYSKKSCKISEKTKCPSRYIKVIGNEKE